MEVTCLNQRWVQIAPEPNDPPDLRRWMKVREAGDPRNMGAVHMKECKRPTTPPPKQPKPDWFDKMPARMFHQPVWALEQDDKWLKIHLRGEDMEGVEKLHYDEIHCEFGENSFDLKILGLNGRNWRIEKQRLYRDIIPEQSRVVVKNGKCRLLLKKFTKWEHWRKLEGKHRKKKADGTWDDTTSLASSLGDQDLEGFSESHRRQRQDKLQERQMKKLAEDEASEDEDELF